MEERNGLVGEDEHLQWVDQVVAHQLSVKMSKHHNIFVYAQDTRLKHV